MNKREAEELYDSGKEPTVSKLLELDDENKHLQEKIAKLQRNSQESSKLPSTDSPTKKEEKSRSKRSPGGQLCS